MRKALKSEQVKWWKKRRILPSFSSSLPNKQIIVAKHCCQPFSVFHILNVDKEIKDCVDKCCATLLREIIDNLLRYFKLD
jgi:hypothetical protein